MTWKFLKGGALLTAIAAVVTASTDTELPGHGGDAVATTPSGTITRTVDMQVGRAAHTATTLSDGRILVAGGFTEKRSAKGAEVYAPQTAKFERLPPMVTTRHSHTASLLTNGKVLIVGGYGAGASTLASAELFDPKTNSFSATGSLGTARADHIAVPLQDGRVLIAGGLGTGWTFLASAEVYDPRTGRFSPTGTMTTPRESHAAVRLTDGRVLIVGGHNGQRRNLALLTSAEIFDPTAGVFRRAGAMRTARHKHDAVLLPDGQVLITGGSDERDDRGVYNSTELFDVTRGIATVGPAMKLGRYKHAGSSVTLSTGHILIAGGAPQAETYDPTTRRFTLVGGEPRMAGQFAAAALLHGGGALITGGYGNGTGPRASAWLFRP